METSNENNPSYCNNVKNDNTNHDSEFYNLEKYNFVRSHNLAKSTKVYTHLRDSRRCTADRFRRNNINQYFDNKFDENNLESFFFKNEAEPKSCQDVEQHANYKTEYENKNYLRILSESPKQKFYLSLNEKNLNVNIYKFILKFFNNLKGHIFELNFFGIIKLK